MGTETRIKELILQAVDDEVKLNNPLMGTETLVDYFIEYSAGRTAVKLNNPLMGTET